MISTAHKVATKNEYKSLEHVSSAFKTAYSKAEVK